LVSIVDVARLADVSAMTVSRVLNEDSRVRPRTRRLVEQAIKELGYVPNEAARGLRNARTRSVGVVVSDLRNPAYLDVIEGMAEVIARHGYSMLLCDSRVDLRLEATNLRRLYERRVEGVVVLPVGGECPDVALFSRFRIPCLPVYLVQPADSAGKMVAGLAGGARSGLRYLAQLGHRRIGYVSASYDPYAPRLRDYEEAMAALDLAVDPALMVSCATWHECLEAIRELLRSPNRPTAIFCGYHLFAPYVLGSIRQAGLRVPEDISFLTMGDSAWAKYYRPAITVITADYSLSGRDMAEYIFARIAGGDGQAEWEQLRHRMKYELAERESTALPPATD
jgi:LacI family transcriptional regulator